MQSPPSAQGASDVESDKSSERASDEAPKGETRRDAGVTFELGKQVARTVTIVAADANGKGNGDAKADGEREVEVPFLFFVPESYADGDRPFPLLLFLHGFGESGNGDFDRIKVHGVPKLVEHERDFDFIVVSPQVQRPERDAVPTAWRPDVLISLLDRIGESVHVDPERTYVTGLSMGGFGTWRLIAAYPNRFAAAVAICGGGEPEMAKRIAKTPVWAFHGEDDPVVELEKSKTMVDAVKTAGGTAILTTYPETGHDSWTETYANRKVYDWLLSNRKEATRE